MRTVHRFRSFFFFLMSCGSQSGRELHLGRCNLCSCLVSVEVGSYQRRRSRFSLFIQKRKIQNRIIFSKSATSTHCTPARRPETNERKQNLVKMRSWQGSYERFSPFSLFGGAVVDAFCSHAQSCGDIRLSSTQNNQLIYYHTIPTLTNKP